MCCAILGAVLAGVPAAYADAPTGTAFGDITTNTVMYSKADVTNYVTTTTGDYLPLSGGTLTGDLGLLDRSYLTVYDTNRLNYAEMFYDRIRLNAKEGGQIGFSINPEITQDFFLTYTLTEIGDLYAYIKYQSFMIEIPLPNQNTSFVYAYDLDAYVTKASVTNSAPTLAWATTSTVGTVGGTALTVKMPANPNTDAKTSSSNKTGTKQYLVTATSQSSSGVTTYSNSGCYIGTDNLLYSGGTAVLTAHQDLSDYATTSDLNTAISNLASVYKPLQTAVSSPSASGTGYQFIATVSQDANGVLTATKQSVREASTSQSGLMTSTMVTTLNTLNSSAVLNGDFSSIAALTDSNPDTLCEVIAQQAAIITKLNAILSALKGE